mmetsp:Transcript_111/g.298  ORF Transcript_111/g.298 Transcript_111/m.298 type:complete len:317 (+) Transcript_111:489-1439(+)
MLQPRVGPGRPLCDRLRRPSRLPRLRLLPAAGCGGGRPALQGGPALGLRGRRRRRRRRAEGPTAGRGVPRQLCARADGRAERARAVDGRGVLDRRGPDVHDLRPRRRLGRALQPRGHRGRRRHCAAQAEGCDPVRRCPGPWGLLRGPHVQPDLRRRWLPADVRPDVGPYRPRRDVLHLCALPRGPLRGVLEAGGPLEGRRGLLRPRHRLLRHRRRLRDRGHLWRVAEPGRLPRRLRCRRSRRRRPRRPVGPGLDLHGLRADWGLAGGRVLRGHPRRAEVEACAGSAEEEVDQGTGRRAGVQKRGGRLLELLQGDGL